MADEFECFCGDVLVSRDELIQHNVDAHEMDGAESRRRVLQKYPEA